MFSASKYVLAAALVALGAGCVWAAPLRICADANDLPYSNRQQQGFENRIADLIARDLGTQVTYFWLPKSWSAFQKPLKSGACDVVMGVPSGVAGALTTRPYYRSSYFFVTRRASHLRISSFDDPRLRSLKIGVHVLGDDEQGILPPVNALLSRGLARNLVLFNLFGNDIREKNPSADLIRAVADGKVDVAVAWGPLAGYFSHRSSVPLEITPITADPKNSQLPFEFNISAAVRKGDLQLRQVLNRELERRHSQIEQILRNYEVPQLALPAIAEVRPTEE